MDGQPFPSDWKDEMGNECEHLDPGSKSTYDNGKCTICGWICEHEEIEKGCCLDCGEFVLKDVEPQEDYPREEES